MAADDAVSLALLNLRPGMSLVFASALREKFVRDARAGDRDAVDWLGMSVKTIPPTVEKAWRDAQLRGAAAWLQSISPKSSPYRIALIISAAGESLQKRGGSLTGQAFSGLSADERDQFEGLIRGILDMLEAPTCWPCLSRLRSILDC